ncbi:MAG: carboxypeptidase-like regulatory domain-containing protein [Betaproteobacteria bacterium]
MKELTQPWQGRRLWTKRGVIVLGLLMGIQAMSLCAGSGRVIDEETGKPLAGVYVIAMWHASGFSPVVSKTVCYHFAITKSDETGNYSLPTFSWNINPLLSDRQRYLEYYIAGYEDSPNNKTGDEVRRLRRSTKNIEERIRNLAHQRYHNCTSETGRREKLLPLYQAQLDEATRLASSPIERGLMESVRAQRLEAEIGFDAYSKLLMEKSKP